jgi:hypothetical protein
MLRLDLCRFERQLHRRVLHCPPNVSHALWSPSYPWGMPMSPVSPFDKDDPLGMIPGGEGGVTTAALYSDLDSSSSMWRDSAGSQGVAGSDSVPKSEKTDRPSDWTKGPPLSLKKVSIVEPHTAEDEVTSATSASHLTVPVSKPFSSSAVGPWSSPMA